MSQNTLTHKALSQLLGVSETTVKSYRRKFPGCIPVASQGKPIRFSPEAAEVSLRIRDLFDLGMSVEEVRARLVGEFAWIQPAEKKDPQPVADRTESAHRGSAEGECSPDLAPDLAIGVSNLAKSMVSMNQQQKSMLERMKGIEHMLAELGLQGPLDGDALRRKSAEAAKEHAARLEDRLDHLDAATQELAGTVASLADQLGNFLGARIRAKEKRLARQDLEDVSFEGRDAPSSVKVVPLRPAELLAPKEEEGAAGSTPFPAEPERRFFTLPLGVRSADGDHVNPRGRGRGPFSLNDLKAMLIYGHIPPNHFTLRWEAYGQGWWLTLERADRSFSLLLMEVVDRKGNALLEILQLRDNGETVHLAGITAIIDMLGG